MAYDFMIFFFSDSFELLSGSTVLRHLMYLAIFCLFVYLVIAIAVLLLEVSFKYSQAFNFLQIIFHKDFDPCGNSHSNSKLINFILNCRMVL